MSPVSEVLPYILNQTIISTISNNYVTLKIWDQRTFSDEKFWFLEMFAVNILNVVVGGTFDFLMMC